MPWASSAKSVSQLYASFLVLFFISSSLLVPQKSFRVTRQFGRILIGGEPHLAANFSELRDIMKVTSLMSE